MVDEPVPTVDDLITSIRARLKANNGKPKNSKKEVPLAVTEVLRATKEVVKYASAADLDASSDIRIEFYDAVASFISHMSKRVVRPGDAMLYTIEMRTAWLIAIVARATGPLSEEIRSLKDTFKEYATAINREPMYVASRITTMVSDINNDCKQWETGVVFSASVGLDPIFAWIGLRNTYKGQYAEEEWENGFFTTGEDFFFI